MRRKYLLSSIVFATLMMITASLYSILVFEDATIERALIMDTPGQEEISTRVYDLFNVPLSTWWADRCSEQILSATFPVSYVALWAPAGNNQIFSDYRMNVTARNISRVNTTSEPCYVPILNSTVRGGNVSINWTANYIDLDEVNRSGYPLSVKMYYDSWFFRWNGTVTMDRTAAKMVLNMTDSEFDGFNAWKASKFSAFASNWSNWIIYEMNVRETIFFAYTWTGSILSESYDVSKSGENITFQIKDHLSYGMESLLGRWWRDTFLSFEGWPEDVHFSANLGPTHSDFNLDMAVQYSLQAKSSTRGNQACWVFENAHADTVSGTNSWQNPVTGEWVNTSSEINPYVSTTGYWNFIVANSNYGMLSSYDFTPWAWNLSSNKHKLLIEWPASGSVIGYNHAGIGVYTDTITGHVDPLWIEPIPGEVPGNLNVNWLSRNIEITGPFDAWAWSKNSIGSTELKANWSRLGLLPHGVPHIEFIVNTKTPPQHGVPISVISSPTGSSTYWTGSSSIYLGGSASDDFAVTSVTWSNAATGGTGTASGTTSWSTTGIPLNVGSNLITVTAHDGFELTGSDTIIVTYTPLSVTGTMNTTAGTAPLSVSFTCTPTGGKAPYAFSWTFGDGLKSTLQNLTHTYAAAGTYTAEVNVTDSASHSTIWTSSEITVTAATSITVTGAASPMSGASPLNVSFTCSASGGTGSYTYSWTFGDGGTSVLQNPSHTYASTGNYSAKVTVSDSTFNNGNWTTIVIVTPNNAGIMDTLTMGLLALALLAVAAIVTFFVLQKRKKTPP